MSCGRVSYINGLGMRDVEEMSEVKLENNNTREREHRLERPVLAVDVVILGWIDGALRVVLWERTAEPFAGALALPGVAVRVDETLEAAALRAVTERLGWTREDTVRLGLEQLATFDALYRDPRGRVVSVAYLGLLREAPPSAGSAVFRPVAETGEKTLPFDHGHIVTTAVERLRGRLRYTNIARLLLPDAFRIEALQDLYEIVLDTRLNRANFRGKLLKIGMIEQVTVLTEAVGKKGGRPPHLYRFTGTGTTTVVRDFL